MKLSAIANRHAGAPIMLCGTGPSLDRVDWSRAPAVRVAVNHAAGIVPPGEAVYGVALDREAIIEIGGYPDHVTPVLPMVMPRNLRAVRPDITLPYRRCVFFREGDFERIETDRDVAVARNELYHCYGTSTEAAYLCWVLGAGIVIFAGMDGTSGWAESVARFGKTGDVCLTGHRRCQQSVIRVLNAVHVPYDDYRPI